MAVSDASRSGWLNAKDTAVLETPAASATSEMVGRRITWTTLCRNSSTTIGRPTRRDHEPVVYAARGLYDELDKSV